MDTMLEQGSEGTAALQALYRIATWPHVEALSTCPACKQSTDTQSVFLHYITHHLRKSKYDIEQVLKTGTGRDIFIQARKFQFCSSLVSYSSLIKLIKLIVLFIFACHFGLMQ